MAKKAKNGTNFHKRAKSNKGKNKKRKEKESVNPSKRLVSRKKYR